MKTVNGTEKPLAEWTLKDMKEFCGIYTCLDCPLYGCICGKPSPIKWRFEEKPKFTEQEIEDAKVLKRLLIVSEIKRDKSNALYASIAGAYFLRISDTSFPSIKNGQIYKISDIIGDADA